MSENCRTLAIIPARYGSTRFPGKPLALIAGKSMIRRTYERASLGADFVAVATDDVRIAAEVESFGGRAVMTSPDCNNGTARVAEAYSKLGIEAGVVVNVQGDEPFVNPDTIRSLAESLLSSPKADIATVAQRFDQSEGFEALFNPNRVKMTFDRSGIALYFSRSIIPYVRGHEWQQWVNSATFHIHTGLYAFRPNTLAEVVSLPPSPLEEAEKLEQLRWLENGYKILTVVSNKRSYEVDTIEDIARIESLIAEGLI